MNPNSLCNLSESEYKEFCRRFPQAVSFLRRIDWRRELERLQRQPECMMNGWQVRRRRELETLNTQTCFMMEA